MNALVRLRRAVESAGIESKPLERGGVVSGINPNVGVAEGIAGYSALNPAMGSTLRSLAALKPQTLALMHGPSFTGDGAAALKALADDYDRRMQDTELAYLFSSEAAQRSLAENYVGLPF